MDTWKIEDLQARAAAQYHGNVEINAHEDALALDVDVGDRLLVEHALRIGRHFAQTLPWMRNSTCGKVDEPADDRIENFPPFTETKTQWKF